MDKLQIWIIFLLISCLSTHTASAQFIDNFDGLVQSGDTKPCGWNFNVGDENAIMDFVQQD